MSKIINVESTKYGTCATIHYSYDEVMGTKNEREIESGMTQIKHIGKVFILGKQGRDVAKISEFQLLECLEILKLELEENDTYEIAWDDVIEYLQDQKK